MVHNGKIRSTAVHGCLQTVGQLVRPSDPLAVKQVLGSGAARSTADGKASQRLLGVTEDETDRVFPAPNVRENRRVWKFL